MGYYTENESRKLVSAIEAIIQILIPEEDVPEPEAARIIILAAVASGITEAALTDMLKELYGE